MARKKRRARRRKRNVNPAPRRRRTTRRRRRNPATASRGGRLFAGLNFKKAIADQVPLQLGIWIAKWCEKRFGPEASDLDPTTWNAFSFVKGALGGALGAVGINAIKRGYGQMVLTGALAEVTRSLIRYELIERSDWAKGQFGQDNDNWLYVDTDAAPYMGALPLDDRHRLAGSLIEPGPLGEDIEPVGALGYYGEDTDFQEYAEDYG